MEIRNTGSNHFDGEVLLEIPDEKAETRQPVRCPGGQTSTITISLPVRGARPWSPDSPHLYQLWVRVRDRSGNRTDERMERFGFRSIRVDGDQILLNGEPLDIKGVNRYDEFKGYGPTVPEEIIRKDLLTIKEMGANLIRVHYPQDPKHLEIMDEIGLLLMEEVPINWWHPESEKHLPYSDRIVAEGENFLRRMIRRDRNHPCLIIWSICNESGTDNAKGIAAMKHLMTIARRLDSSRLVTFVAVTADGHKAFADADLVAINLYYGSLVSDLARHPDEMDELVRERTEAHLRRTVQLFPGKPVVLTEFGTHAVPGTSGETRFSETHQGQYLAAVWKAVVAVESVRGGVIWSWADYHHRRDFFYPHGSRQWQSPFGPYGLVGVDRKPKASLTVVKHLFAEHPPSGSNGESVGAL